jgi:hypothetical protein
MSAKLVGNRNQKRLDMARLAAFLRDFRRWDRETMGSKKLSSRPEQIIAKR